MFLTFKCHVYIKKCFPGILITLVNSQGDVKWLHGACDGREGQREELMGKKRVGLTNTQAALAGRGVTDINGTIAILQKHYCIV